MKKAGMILAAAFCTLMFSAPAKGQVPILYYDFENNTTRTTFENLVEQAVNSGSGAITRAGNTTTISAVGGAGTFNGGAATGQAATGTNWDASTTDPGATATNYYQFVVNTSGFSQMYITFDNQASGSGPARVGVLYSTDGSTFTATTTALTGNNAFSAATFDLSGISAINNQTSVTIRLYAFAGSAADRVGRSAFGSTGTFRIDNLTVLAKTATSSKTLLDYPAIGLSLRSGTALTPTYVDFTVNGAGITVALASALVASGTVTVSNGTLACGANIVSGAGTFTLSSGATLGIGDANGITTAPTASGNIQTGTRSFNTAANYTYNGSAAQVTGNGLPSTVNDLTVANGAGVSLSASVTVNGTLTLTSGAFAVGGNTLTLNGPAIAGTPTNLSTTSSSFLIFGGSSAGVVIPSSVTALGNLTIQKTGGAVTLTGNVTISGNLRVNSGTFDLATFTANGGGIFQVQTGSTLKVGGGHTTGYPGSSNFPTGYSSPVFNAGGLIEFNADDNQTINPVPGASFGNLTLSGATASRTKNAGGALTIRGTLTNNNFISFAGSVTFTIDGGIATTDGGVNGSTTAFTNLTISTTSPVVVSGAATVTGTLTLSTNTLNNSTGTITLGNGATISRDTGTLSAAPIFGASANVSYTGTTGVTTSNELPSSSTVLNNLTINKSGGVTLGASPAANGTLTLTSGALAIGANTLTINGAISTSSGSLTGGATSNISVGGSGASTTLPGITLNNLTLNRANGISLGGDVTVGGALTLTNGALSIGANTLTLNGSASIASGGMTGGSSSHIVVGGSGSVVLPSVTLGNLTIQKTGGAATLAGNVTVNGNLRVNSGTLDLSTFTANGVGAFGQIFQVQTGSTLKVGGGHTTGYPGSSNFPTGYFSPAFNAGGLIEFNADDNQTIAPVPGSSFGNVTLSGATGSRTKNASGALTIRGTLTNNNFISFTGSVTFTIDGGITTTDGGVNGSTTTFTNLTIDTTSPVNLSGGNATVTGLLTLNADVTTGANILTQTGTSAGAGDVVGTVRRTDVTNSAKSFGNVNVTITNSVVGPITVDVTLFKGSAPGGFASAVQRSYSITGTPGSAILRLRYLDSELQSNAEASLHLWKAVGSPNATWTDQGVPASVDTTNNYVQNTGVTSFSNWALASAPQAPTDIAMVGYGASHSREGKTLLQWETGREVNNLGFNIYREVDGKRVRVNKSLIVGSGLTANPGTVMSAGRSYAWMASPAQAKGAIFWIEEIDFSGRTLWHGPIQSQEAPGGMLTMSADQQVILEQTSTYADLAEESVNSGVTRPVETFATMAKPAAMKLTGAVITPQPPGNPFTSSVKISLKQAGWYRITQPQLVAAGLNPSSNANSLQLFADGVEVPMSVTANNGVFDSTSAIEFFGLAIDTTSTDTHVYTLGAGAAGQRIQDVTGQGGLPPANSFLYTVERRDRTTYSSGIHNGDAENFFGAVVGSSPIDQAITVTNLDATAAGQATVEIVMQGLSLTPHVVTVNLNGNPIGTISYDSHAQGVSQFTVPNNMLSEGQNIVTLSGQPAEFDLSFVDRIRVSYWHAYAADGNALKFTAAANQQVSLTGFTSSDVKVFDVTNPNQPTKVAASVTAQKTSSAFVVTVAVPGTGTRTLLAIADDQTRSPQSVITDKASSWKNKSNAADLVIIAHDSVKESFKPLQALRQSQGLKVALIDVADLYDEFNFGNKSPQAIKDFLAYARSTWKTAPKYVLLAGSASYDPKGYNGLGGYDLVPTKLIDTVFSETASDDWVADFNLDGIAEMAVGRLPVPTAIEAQTTVNKLAAYQNGETFNSSLLVADGNLDFDFEAANASLAALFPGTIAVQQVNRGQLGTAAAKQQLMTGIGNGQKFVNYVGHGSPSIWRDGLLTSADATAMTNIGRYPVFITMTCLNGQFHHPQLNPLASALMNSREGGAIAVWASTGYTIPAEQTVMNQQFYTLLFQSSKPGNGKGSQAGQTLGEITTSAKSSVSDPDIRRTWILFGDPSMRVK